VSLVVFFFLFVSSLKALESFDCPRAEEVYLNCLQEVYSQRKLSARAIPVEQVRFQHFCRKYKEDLEKCFLHEKYFSCPAQFFCIHKLYLKKQFKQFPK
jgi:hypothetical protein